MNHSQIMLHFMPKLWKACNLDLDLKMAISHICIGELYILELRANTWKTGIQKERH